jgi:hypothetical protein
MIDLMINGLMLTGIALVSVTVLLFSVLGVVHMAYGAYTLTSED